MWTFLLFVALFLPLGQTHETRVVVEPTAEELETYIDVHPTADDEFQLLDRPSPDTYTCTAAVELPGDPPVTGSLVVYVRPGRSSSKTLDKGDVSVTFTAGVMEPGDRVLTSIEIRRSGVLTHRQRSTVSIPARSR